MPVFLTSLFVNYFKKNMWNRKQMCQLPNPDEPGSLMQVETV